MANLKQRIDGWVNLFTQLGRRNDPSTNTYFERGLSMDRETASALYETGGIARKIVDARVNDMTREWIEIAGDVDNVIKKGMEKINTKQAFAEALRWGYVYGGSAIILLCDDGRDISDPLIDTNIKAFYGLRVVDRYSMYYENSMLNNDPRSQDYGKPMYYKIESNNGSPYLVHVSRMILFDGEPISERSRTRNNGWGASIYENLYRAIMDVGSTLGYTGGILRDYSTGTLTVKGLTELIATDSELVRKRLEILNLSRSIMNMVLLDEGEMYNKVTASVSGLPDVIDRFNSNLAAVADMPVTRLFGISPGGLNATGESDTRYWYDYIRATQGDKMAPGLNRLCDIFARLNGVDPDTTSITFKSLWTPSQLEFIDMKFKQADIDTKYWQMEVLSPEEIRESRFASSDFSFDTKIEYENEPDSNDSVGGIDIEDEETENGADGVNSGSSSQA